MAGCMRAMWTSAGRGASRSRRCPKVSTAASSAAARPSPVSARPQPSTSAPASAALTATSTNETAWTPPSSATWITGSLRYCE